MCLSRCSVVVMHKPGLLFKCNNDSNIWPPFPLNCDFVVVKGESSNGSSEFVVHAAFWSKEEFLAGGMTAEIQCPAFEK